MKKPQKQLACPSNTPQQPQKKQNNTSNKGSTAQPEISKGKKQSEIEDIFKSVKK